MTATSSGSVSDPVANQPVDVPQADVAVVGGRGQYLPSGENATLWTTSASLSSRRISRPVATLQRHAVPSPAPVASNRPIR